MTQTHKFMSKSELAMLYVPNCTPHRAVNVFMEWIGKNSELMSKLMETGYKKTQKVFRPDQVRLIFPTLTSLNVRESGAFCPCKSATFTI